MRIVRFSRKPPGHLRSEGGFSLVVALLMLLISSSIVAVVLTVATSDINLTQHTTNQKRAYAAALAGIQDYQFQLNTSSSYWETCPTISHRAVPGDSSAQFTVETVAATGHHCTPGTINAFGNIIQSGDGTAGNTFRVMSTGTVIYGGRETSRTIVASFTGQRFTEDVYFSNYEVQDPATYQYDNHTPTHCENYYSVREEKGYTSECPGIEFATGDSVNGSMHTNDAADICGTPTFGRANKGDKIQMVGGDYECSGSHPTFNGTRETGGETITIPTSDDELETLAGYKFTGRTEIELNNNMIKVTNAKYPKGETMAFPSSAVIYVENASAGCSEDYTSYKSSYEEPNCGNVYVKGRYTESLTIAAENDIIIDGNVTTTTKNNVEAAEPIGTATLGLIADKFVRIYHPVEKSYLETYEEEVHGGQGGYGTKVQKTREVEYTNEFGKCTAPNASGAIKNPIIDASILTTDNSFIVDNYECGEGLGTLTVWGSITQNWRGPVGTLSGNTVVTGYSKSYNYDERLKEYNPPDFLNPTSHWRIYRETEPSSTELPSG